MVCSMFEDSQRSAKSVLTSYSPLALQGSYDKLMAEVPKYKMITPSVLADRLRVSPNSSTQSQVFDCMYTLSYLVLMPRPHQWFTLCTMAVQINGSLARAAIRDLAEKGTIRVVSKSGHQEIWTRSTNTDAA